MLHTIIDLVDSHLSGFDLPARTQELVGLSVAKTLGSDYLWNIQYSETTTTSLEREAIASSPQRAAGCRSLDAGERMLCTFVPLFLTRTRLQPTEMEQLRAHFPDRHILEVIELIGFSLMLARTADLCGTPAPTTGWPSMADAAAPAYEDHGGNHHGPGFRAPYWGDRS